MTTRAVGRVLIPAGSTTPVVVTALPFQPTGMVTVYSDDNVSGGRQIAVVNATQQAVSNVVVIAGASQGGMVDAEIVKSTGLRATCALNVAGFTITPTLNTRANQAVILYDVFA